MTSWLDQINVPQATPQPPPQQQTAAPGAWWQQGTQYQQPVTQQPQQYQPPPTTDYRPATAESLNNDRCPRCNSEEYAPVHVDLTFGGSSYGGAQLLSQTGGVMKRCFDCRYPQFNATGDIIRGKGLPAGADSSMTTLRPRQSGNARQGSWSNQVWDNAPLIA